MQDRVAVSVLFGMHHMRRDAAPLDRKIRPDIVRIFFDGIIVDPFIIVVIADPFEAFDRDLRKIQDIMRDINRILTGGFGSCIVFGRCVFHFIMDNRRIGMPGVIVFRNSLAVQCGRSAVQNDPAA